MNNKKLDQIRKNEYQSIRYLNLFRLLLSFFFFSIIFKQVGNFVGFSYKLDIAKLIAVIYLSFSIITWSVSFIYQKNIKKIGILALAIDLPIIISLTLLLDASNDGWVILPVITIGSFSMLSSNKYATITMPIVATLLLWLLPEFLGIESVRKSFSQILQYAFTYIAIALLGLRQSQAFSHTLKIAQQRKKQIIDLSTINETIIDHMQSGTIVLNKDYEVELINKKAKEVVKVLTGEKIPDLLIKKIISTPELSSNSFSLYGEDVIINMVKLDQHNDMCLLFIEQQSQINEKSQQINLATMGQLSATIAHELRNPMAAIYSASQLLQESEVSEEDKELTEIIIKQIERSNKIIEDILLMSKQHIAAQTNINLIEKLSTFKKEYCSQNDISSKSITIEFDSNSLAIKFDGSHLSQLLWNLTSNALKHGLDGKLLITISNEQDYILLDFINNGEKFNAIVEESLFTPFFTTHTQGTGLGLHICREMCRSNNAKLEYLRQDLQHVFRIHIKK